MHYIHTGTSFICWHIPSRQTLSIAASSYFVAAVTAAAAAGAADAAAAVVFVLVIVVDVVAAVEVAVDPDTVAGALAAAAA